MKYNSVVTNIGMAKIANQVASGEPLTLTHIALGDGNGSSVVPQQQAAALVREVYRGQINNLYRPDDDPAQIVTEMVVLPHVGGWMIREVGVFDNAGDMIIYASSPEIYKPKLTEGSGMDFTVSVRAIVGNDTEVTLKVDQGVVVAMRGWVTKELEKHNALPEAHGATLMPWINDGIVGLARIDDKTITLEGDRRSLYPRGKRLRFNGLDTFLCRVFGAPTHTNGKTVIKLWFDERMQALPAEITKFERTRLMPQDTANGALMSREDSIETINTLLASYCCGGYWTED